MGRTTQVLVVHLPHALILLPPKNKTQLGGHPFDNIRCDTTPLIEVLILLTVSLNRSSLNMGHALVIPLKSRPDLKNMIKFRKWKICKRSILGLTVNLMVLNQILINLNNKHHISLIQTNFPYLGVDTSQVCQHLTLLVGVFGPDEKGSVATTVLYVFFVDQKPLKVDWSLVIWTKGPSKMNRAM